MAYTAVQATTAKSEMNVVPLIDVLLVLLIIFMVTVPAVTGAITLDLPQAEPPKVQQVEPEPMRLAVDRDGQTRLDGRPVDARDLHAALLAAVNLAEVEDRLQPMLQVAIDPDAHYQSMASALAVARDAGMVRIGMDSAGR